MLAELLGKIANFEVKEYKYSHRCSNATYGERCRRESVYNALGVPAKGFSDRFALVLNDSSWHEELTCDFVRKSGFKLHSEQMELIPYEINGKPVKGHIDGLITPLDVIRDMIFEHKAITTFTFASYEEGNLHPYDYVCQCVHYIVGYYNETGKWINALLLIKNKNNARYLEYHIEYDPQEDIAKVKLFVMDYESNELGALTEIKEFFMEEVIQRAKARFEEIDRYVAEKKLPLRQYDIENYHCQYCRWSGLCWKDYEKEIDDRKEGVKITDVELLEKFKFYDETNDGKKACEKLLKKMSAELTVYFQNENIKQATGGGLIITLTKKQRSKLNKKMIPADLLYRATSKTTYEAFSVYKPKLKKEKEAKK